MPHAWEGTAVACAQPHAAIQTASRETAEPGQLPLRQLAGPLLCPADGLGQRRGRPASRSIDSA